MRMTEVMEIHVNNKTFRLELGLEDVKTSSIAFSPVLSFIGRVSLMHPTQLTGELYLLGVYAKVKVVGNQKTGYAGKAHSDQPFIRLMPGIRGDLSLTIDLDYFILEQIEKFREGGDAIFEFELQGVVLYKEQNNILLEKIPSHPHIIYRVPKSDWVEKILSDLGYKNVWLIEVPDLKSPEELTEAVTHLSNAWKQFSMGEYKNTLVECRRALEVVGNVVKKAGFVRKVDGKSEPDWGELVNDKDIGERFEKIFRSLRGFLSPGAHTGKLYNREDANLALMTTHAIVYYAIRKFLENI